MKMVLAVFLPIIIAFSMQQTAYAEDNDTCISETAYEACVEYGEQYNISPELLMAIIERESCGQADVIGGDCKGLMQINEKFHTDRMKRLGVTDIFDERGNILVGADYLAELFAEYHDAAVVLMAYHGERNVIEKAESGRISSYAQGILDRSAELEKIHETSNEK